MRRKFILNPYSGRAVAGSAIAGLERFFTAKTGGFDYAVAVSRDEAVRITRECLREGIDQIVAVGGDGTVNAVANGFFENGRPVRPESCLAVANAGTGSDYFKSLSQNALPSPRVRGESLSQNALPSPRLRGEGPGVRGLGIGSKSLTAGTAVPDWKELVLRHVSRPADVGRIRYADPNLADQYFVNMASAGMVAEVVSRKNRGPRWLPPRLRYLVPTIGGLLAYSPRPVQIEVDGVGLDAEVLVISVCKGVYAGHGMRFGGAVTLFDGLFDVTLFGPMNRVEMLVKLKKLYTGAFQGEPAIQKLKARRVSIRAPAALPVEFDGELGGTTDVELSVEPQSLRVCFPRGLATFPAS